MGCSLNQGKSQAAHTRTPTVAACTGQIRAKRRTKKSGQARAPNLSNPSAYVYAMMNPLSTKKKSTAIYPCGAKDGIQPEAASWAAAEKC